ncbi:MAG TPA: Holliday junction branch migration protein RuvA [Myxococcota bacterium]|nr:Holliday junction branch migration protein RuvA [Myxococcota bacterium]
MIARIRGQLVELGDDRVLVDVRGVGYELRCGGRLQSGLALGEEVTLSVSTQVREDSITLYGFLGSEERGLFEQLMGITGVGPKLALSLVDTLGVAGLAMAIHSEDTRMLLQVPGIGKKTAQRLVLELKGKIVRQFSPTGPTITPPPGNPPLSRDPLRLALARLGYRKSEIDSAEAGLRAAGLADAPLQERLSGALRILSGSHP